MESTEFDKHLVGTQKHTQKMNMKILQTLHRRQQYVRGIKTYNAAIAVDNDKAEVKTVLEQAKEKGNQRDSLQLLKLHMQHQLLSVRMTLAVKIWTQLQMIILMRKLKEA